MEDVFAIQDDISESIVRALRVILGDAERKALKARTQDIRAYEYYLRGRQYVDLRKKSLKYALEMFRRAVEIDPEYASAHAGIADTLSLMYLLFETNTAFIDEAEGHAVKALALDPDLAEAHAAAGMVQSCRRDYEKSNREFETAIRLDPKGFDAPYFWGRNLIWQGRYEEAVHALRRAQALRPESYDTLSMIALAYTGMGREPEARAMRSLATKIMEERLELNPDDARAWVLIACQYGSEHDRFRTEQAIQRALAIDDDALTYYNAACAHALLGDEEKAIDYLEIAVQRNWHHKEWLEHDTDWDFMRENPRFRKLVEIIGAKS
jgi:tetratricopeptide (TPR) repeat protein